MIRPSARIHAQSTRPPALGITLLETLIVIFVVVLILGIFVPVITPRSRVGARQLKDSTQVRGIQQAMVVWANSNKWYPMPSLFDGANATVNAAQDTKDTTGNIYSLMIFNSSISPEICVSPSEVSPDVEFKGDYQYSSPRTAARPSEALWDPSFRGTPEDGGRAIPGNQSYGHLIPIGQRLEMWSDTFSSTQPVLGNRGPAFAETDAAAGVESGRWQLLPGRLGAGSRTLQIHGGRSTWEGNIAYNDNHVSFETKPNPETATYVRAASPSVPIRDNLFVVESDERSDIEPGDLSKGVNAYLRPVSSISTGRVGVWRD